MCKTALQDLKGAAKAKITVERNETATAEQTIQASAAYEEAKERKNEALAKVIALRQHQKEQKAAAM